MKAEDIKQEHIYVGKEGSFRKCKGRTYAACLGYGDDVFYWKLDKDLRAFGRLQITSKDAFARWAREEVVPPEAVKESSDGK